MGAVQCTILRYATLFMCVGFSFHDFMAFLLPFIWALLGPSLPNCGNKKKEKNGMVLCVGMSQLVNEYHLIENYIRKHVNSREKG